MPDAWMIELAAGAGGAADVVVGVGAGAEVGGDDTGNEAATLSEVPGDVVVVGAGDGFVGTNDTAAEARDLEAWDLEEAE